MPRPENFRHLDHTARASRKPHGGLWTSTWTGDGSDWTRWCEDDGFRVPSEEWSGLLLTPCADARIYTIDDIDDLRALVRQYPAGDVADYVAVAREFDAIHLTDAGQWATRMTLDLDLYGWDCESTVWFRWTFESAEPVRFPVSDGHGW